mmetsp:Transcript_28818/g.84474  ORF Transcript_28818/g.84474 Transcript_28818/m.84474 type:complete len:93 (-) Transcript_28818:555-833(-)
MSTAALRRLTSRKVAVRTLSDQSYTEAEQLTQKVASYFPRFTTLSLSREDEVTLYVLPEHMDKVAHFLRDSSITQMKTIADASATPVNPPKS